MRWPLLDNYPGLRERCSCREPDDPTRLRPEIVDRRAIAELVNGDPGASRPRPTTLSGPSKPGGRQHCRSSKPSRPNGRRKGNVYALRRALLASIEQAFADTTLLTGHQIRGAFARYVDDLKADLKSIAASGWGPELIPDADILESQFPELLAEMEQKRLRLAELAALFAAADEEDYEDSDDTGVLPERARSRSSRPNQRSQGPGEAGQEGSEGDWDDWPPTERGRSN
jgi:type I restriction enzyme M protein